jgi:hypothetical protein
MRMAVMVEMRTDIQRTRPTAGMRTWIRTSTWIGMRMDTRMGRDRQEWDREQA